MQHNPTVYLISWDRSGTRTAQALICHNDTAALAVLHGLEAAGAHVPADVSVVGYDDLRFAAQLSPSLTTVAQPS